jgi:hypothetical protein
MAISLLATGNKLSKRDSAATTMRRINRACRDGQVEDLAQMVHPEIVMVFPA